MILKHLILEKSNQQYQFNFISSKQTDKERVTHSKSDNIKIMINDQAMKL